MMTEKDLIAIRQNSETINNMKKRIADINGEIEIKSTPNKGTTVQIKFPKS